MREHRWTRHPSGSCECVKCGLTVTAAEWAAALDLDPPLPMCSVIEATTVADSRADSSVTWLPPYLGTTITRPR